MVDRQQALGGLAGEQPLPGAVVAQRLGVAIQQQRRLRIGVQPGGARRLAGGRDQQAAQQGQRQLQGLLAGTVLQLQQQQTGLPWLQGQGLRQPLLDAGAAQPAGQPAGHLAQLGQRQPRLLLQQRMQRLVVEGQRIVRRWRQAPPAHRQVAATGRLPGQVPDRQHRRAAAQQLAQRRRALRQRALLAHPAQQQL